MPIPGLSWLVALVLHAATFFFSALVCHQALAGRRPEPARLTEFYLCVSIGGVVGGAATALLAPVIFNSVVEYPIVLVLIALARPAARRALDRADLVVIAVAGAALVATMALSLLHLATLIVVICLLLAVWAAATLLRSHRTIFALALLALAIQGAVLSQGGSIHRARTFFGVHRVSDTTVPQLGGQVRLIAHGTTIHGSQAQAPAFRCQPGAYYVRRGAIAQTYIGMGADRPAMRIGVVGLGAGATAAYMRPTDSLRYFEIDPAVERIARDPRLFSYLSECARGPVDVVLGDARLTLAKEPPGSYDLLHLDAFSSDAIPTHLLTVQALQQYLRALKPDGVLLVHMTNRHLALDAPVAAAAQRLGATAVFQEYWPQKGAERLVDAHTRVMLIAKSPEALKRFTADSRWRPAQARGRRPWTDDYTNVMGALIDGLSLERR